ncbi:potassium channel KOR2-like [Vitis vinifera]|uniref:potassium channel KOR2-like n=1 Tax=Vitis vinifera TaxID=29760 RepID=UPI002882E4C2|nr:potassium channel KOR2-like [Vitis vinifera]
MTLCVLLSKRLNCSNTYCAPPLGSSTVKKMHILLKFIVSYSTWLQRNIIFENSPLFEAVKAGHDSIALLLIKHGSTLNLEDAGWYLCKAVMDSNIDLLKRLLENGVNPNSRNYDLQTPLHFAAAEGLHLVANILIKFGADVLSKGFLEALRLVKAVIQKNEALSTDEMAPASQLGGRND